jgi:hypothetical protein
MHVIRSIASTRTILIADGSARNAFRRDLDEQLANEQNPDELRSQILELARLPQLSSQTGNDQEPLRMPASAR